MRAWNRKRKLKHWTKPKWYTIKVFGKIYYFSLITKCMKRCNKDMLIYSNLITNKSFRFKKVEKKCLLNSMYKNKKYITAIF